jgi:hypothetical protein
MTNNEEVFSRAKKVFYDIYDTDPYAIDKFANELARHFDSCNLSYIQRLHDGINFSYKYNGDCITLDEMTDIIVDSFMDFYSNYTVDREILMFLSVKNNISSLIKIFIIDRCNFSVVI